MSVHEETGDVHELRFLRALERNLGAPRDETKLLGLFLNEITRFLGDVSASFHEWPGGAPEARRATVTRGAFPRGLELPEPGRYEGPGRLPGFAATGIRERGLVVGELFVHRPMGDFRFRERELVRRAGEILSREVTRRRGERLLAIEDRLHRKILGELRPEDLFYQILDGLRSLTGYNLRAAVAVLDPERGELVIRAEKLAWKKGKSHGVGRGILLEPEERDILRSRPQPALARRAGGAWSEVVLEPVPGHGEEAKGRLLPPELIARLAPSREPEEPEPASLVVNPLSGGGVLVGLLLAWGDDPWLFGPTQLPGVERLARLAAVAVLRARVSEQRERELEAIRSIGEFASRPTGQGELAEHILRCALEVLAVPAGSIELVDAEAGALRTLAELGRQTLDRPPLALGEGIIGTVALTGQPVLEDDVSRNPVYVSRVATTRSELAVPLRYREKTIGVLNVESSVPARFGPDDVRFLSILAAQAAGALKASEFYRTTLRQVEEGRDRIRLLQRMGSLLASIEETDALLAAVASEARRWLRSEEASVHLLRQGRLECAAEDRRGDAVPHADERGIESLTAAAADPPDRAPFGRVIRRPLEGAGRGHFLAVPLRSSERLIGVLRVLNKLDTSGRPSHEGFTQDDEDSLVSIASQVSVAISEHLKQRRLYLLHQLEKAFREARDMDAACQAAIDLVTSPLMGYRGASIRIANQFQDLELRAASRSADGTPPEDTLARGEGIAGSVHETGDPVLIARIDENDTVKSAAWARALGATSVYCVPLRATARSIGTLAVLSAEENPFTEEERNFLGTLAHHLALALENLALVENLEGLRRVSEALLSSGSLDAILRVVLEHAAETVGADPVVLYLYRKEEDRFEVPPIVVGDLHDAVSLHVEVNQSHAARRVLASGASMFVEGVPPDEADGFAEREGVASAARMLLMAGAEPLGVLFFNFRHPRVFTPAGKGLLYSFANEATLAIRTARLVEARTREIERLARYVHSAPAAILEVDADGKVLFANEATGGMLRTSAGRRLTDEIEAGRPPLLREGELRDVFDRVRRDGSFAAEFRDRGRGERPGYVYLTVTPLGTEADRERFLIVARDLTELRELQSRATLAEFARGVAHDVNNSLGAVVPLAQAVREDLEQGGGNREEIIEDLIEIERYVKSCRRIFQGMLRASRDKHFRTEKVRVDEVALSTLELMKGRFAKLGITATTDFEPGLPAIAASATALEQIFLNLLDNAAQAMPSGGSIEVVAHRMWDGVAIAVRDTGIGIPKEDLPRIFEPFFTTRPENTGLGLSSCRALVWEFGGKIDVESEPGRGTVMKLWFPLMSREVGDETVGAPEEGHG